MHNIDQNFFGAVIRDPQYPLPAEPGYFVIIKHRFVMAAADCSGPALHSILRATETAAHATCSGCPFYGANQRHYKKDRIAMPSFFGAWLFCCCSVPTIAGTQLTRSAPWICTHPPYRSLKPLAKPACHRALRMTAYSSFWP